MTTIEDIKARMDRIIARLGDYAPNSPEHHVLTQQFQHLSMVEEYESRFEKLPPIVE